MHRLILLRHGKSDWRHNVDDFDRPLKRRGKDAAFRAGQWLSEHGFIFDLIVSSPAERAYSTAILCAKGAGIDPKLIETHRDLYLADISDFLSTLNSIPWRNKTVLVVAHNPGLDDMVHYLSSTPVSWDDDGKLMSTAAFAIFESTSDSFFDAPHQATLVTRKRPQALD